MQLPSTSLFGGLSNRPCIKQLLLHPLQPSRRRIEGLSCEQVPGCCARTWLVFPMIVLPFSASPCHHSFLTAKCFQQSVGRFTWTLARAMSFQTPTNGLRKGDATFKLPAFVLGASGLSDVCRALFRNHRRWPCVGFRLGSSLPDRT